MLNNGGLRGWRGSCVKEYSCGVKALQEQVRRGDVVWGVRDAEKSRVTVL